MTGEWDISINFRYVICKPVDDPASWILIEEFHFAMDHRVAEFIKHSLATNDSTGAIEHSSDKSQAYVQGNQHEKC